jgi:transposase InsO family protein
MPWKTKNEQEQRYELVRAMKAGVEPVTGLCRRWKVSRKTAYKWLDRYRREGLQSLADQSREPARVPGRTPRHWLERLRRLRRKLPTWGARKLRHRLELEHGPEDLPAVATLSRWLKDWGLARGRRRQRSGPVVLRAATRPARQVNEVWTVDFKGSFQTGDGTRVYPLTVRDLYSRYGLCVALLSSQSVAMSRREFEFLFSQYGLPERIRCDNGTPFGGAGPTGLTRLSAWWIKLGMEVEFTTPGRPCENGAHEQFHRVYKAEVAKGPTWRRAEQQRRSNRWLRQYNEERPHEALGMGVPAEWYRPSPRALPARIRPWDYPGHWLRRWVKGNGEISWKGKRRFVGEAFVRDFVGLKPMRKGVWRVYFGPILVGELHEQERGNIRLAKYRPRPKAPKDGIIPARFARLHDAVQGKVSPML